MNSRISAWLATASLCAGLLPTPLAAAPSAESLEKQQKLIATLESNAPAGEKAVACKLLAIYGGDQAVAAVAKLLPDPNLSSWSRISLEAIPGEASNQALREAAGKLQGRLLVGVINSLGVKADPKAVDILVPKLKNSDAEVASAAAVALGKIGGSTAAEALTAALATAPEPARAAVAEGSIRCAEKFLAANQDKQAADLYDSVRNAKVPKQKVREGTRGAILARRTGGMFLLVEQLKSKDKDMFTIGLSAARELAGTDVTKGLCALFKNIEVERKPLLLLAIADRKDPAGSPTIVEAAKTGADDVRVVAIGVMERSGDASSLPTLIDAAATGSPQVSQAATTALARMGGPELDVELKNRLESSQGKERQVLLEVAGQRYLEGSLPIITKSAEDPDPGIRRAAAHTLGAVGEAQQLNDLVRMLSATKDEGQRADLTQALIGISGRKGSGCAQPLLPLTQSPEPGLRIAGLQALVAAGGSDALTAVKAAADDKDSSVQDEAVRTLSSWPNTWPEDAAVEEPLLAMVKSDRKLSHQVLATRGYLQFLQGDRKLSAETKVTKIEQLIPVLKRPEEKRLAISTLGAIPSTASLKLLSEIAKQTDFCDDACSAIVTVAGKPTPGLSSDDRRAALKKVTEMASSDSTKQRAEEALKRVR